MNKTEYHNYILDIITRLHSENSMSLRDTITREGKLAFVLEFNAPKWFSELNNKEQHVAYDNLLGIIKKKVSKLGFESIECIEIKQCDNCEHRNKRARF